MPQSGDRDGDVHGAVDDQEEHRGRAEGSESLNGFGILGYTRWRSWKSGTTGSGQGPETGVLPGIKGASVFASTEEETGLSGSGLHPLEPVKL